MLCKTQSWLTIVKQMKLKFLTGNLLKLEEGRKEGRTHPWQPARLIGWNSIWVGQCDISAIHPVKASYDISRDLMLVLGPIGFYDAIQLALAGCKFSWAAQVLQCFSALDEPLPLVADAPIAIDIDLLQVLFLRDRLASFDSLPQDPRLAPSAGVKLCTYHRWFGRPQNAACPSYWESPMGNAKLHRILRFRMGSHHLPIEDGRHLNQPRASCVCNLCNTGALGDEKHMVLECPALAGLRLQFSSLLLSCSSIMRRLLCIFFKENAK